MDRYAESGFVSVTLDAYELTVEYLSYTDAQNPLYSAAIPRALPQNNSAPAAGELNFLVVRTLELKAWFYPIASTVSRPLLQNKDAPRRGRFSS